MDRPILFSTPMVKAIIDGKKTQTRRVIKNQGLYGAPKSFKAYPYKDDETLKDKFGFQSDDGEWVCPFGKPGDLLWVRETFKEYDDWHIVYKAEDELNQEYPNMPWKPSIFMPKKYARIWLKITDIRVERVHDISEKDAIAEGIENSTKFKSLWDLINKKRGYGWDRNPYVWVVEFERSKK